MLFFFLGIAVKPSQLVRAALESQPEREAGLSELLLQHQSLEEALVLFDGSPDDYVPGLDEPLHNYLGQLLYTEYTKGRGGLEYNMRKHQYLLGLKWVVKENGATWEDINASYEWVRPKLQALGLPTNVSLYALKP